MAANNNIPGIPMAQLPSWAENGVGSLSQGYLDKRTRRPMRATGGWLGDLQPLKSSGSLPINIDTSFTGRGIDPNGNGITPVTGLNPAPSGINWNNVAEAANKVTPFISNIANSFRRVPQPIAPTQLAPITLGRVNNANELANIDSQTRASDVAADRGLDGNTAAAARQGNLVTKLRAYGDSYSRVNNTNTEIGNQETMFNAGIGEKNARNQDDYNDKKVSAAVAQQRASSENLANASDKYVSLVNAKAQRDLDDRKWRDYSRLFNKGVIDRFNTYVADPTKEGTRLQDERNAEDDNYRKPKKAMGGSIKRLKKAY